MTAEAELDEMLPPAKERLGPRGLKRKDLTPVPESAEGAQPCCHLDFRLLTLEPRQNKLLLSEVIQLVIVTAALWY